RNLFALRLFGGAPANSCCSSKAPGATASATSSCRAWSPCRVWPHGCRVRGCNLIRFHCVLVPYPIKGPSNPRAHVAPHARHHRGPAPRPRRGSQIGASPRAHSPRPPAPFRAALPALRGASPFPSRARRRSSACRAPFWHRASRPLGPAPRRAALSAAPLLARGVGQPPDGHLLL